MVAKRVSLMVAGLVAAIAIALSAGLVWTAIDAPNGSRGTALVGGPFTLTDQNGQTVTADAFKGQPFLVFFGYTHCPDVCPTTLSDMTQVLQALGPSKPAHAVFITVDPERDTSAVLKDYLSSFDPRITGLTGTPDAIAAVEKAYRVYAKRGPSENGGYAMDHTSLVYLMDKDGQFAEAFNLQQPPQKAAAEFSAFM